MLDACKGHDYAFASHSISCWIELNAIYLVTEFLQNVNGARILESFRVMVLTHFSPVLLFYTPWKHQKTVETSDACRGYRKATPDCSGLIFIEIQLSQRCFQKLHRVIERMSLNKYLVVWALLFLTRKITIMTNCWPAQ